MANVDDTRRHGCKEAGKGHGGGYKALYIWVGFCEIENKGVSLCVWSNNKKPD